MIAHCVRNTGNSLGDPIRGHFYTLETEYHVEVGKDYRVFGLGIFETILLALVKDETQRPNWFPIGLFDVGRQMMPADWEFALCDGIAASGGDATNRWVAKWGYSELVRDEGHSDALIERDPNALDVFFREVGKLTDGLERD